MNRRITVAECLVILAKAVLISAAFLILADYFALPFFAEAGGA